MLNEIKTSFDGHKYEIVDLDLASFVVIVNGEPKGLHHHEPWWPKDLIATFGFPPGDEIFLIRNIRVPYEPKVWKVDDICDFRLDDMDQIKTAPPVGGAS